MHYSDIMTASHEMDSRQAGISFSWVLTYVKKSAMTDKRSHLAGIRQNEDSAFLTSSSQRRNVGAGQCSGLTSTTEKRSNNEARKEQNRVASRKYREKRRQRLALLNQILLSIDKPEAGNSRRVNECIVNNEPALTAIEPSYSEPCIGSQQELVIAPTNAGLPSFEIYDQQMLEDITGSMSDGICFDSTIEQGAIDPTILSLSGSNMSSTLKQTATVEMPEFEQMEPSTESPGHRNNMEDPLFKVLDNIQLLTSSQKRQVMGLLKFEADQEKDLERSSGKQDRLLLDSNEKNFNESRAILLHMKSQVREYESWLGKSLCDLSLPDPKMNTIRVVHSSFYAALLANSTAIGLFDFEILKEEGLSPFSIDHENGYPQDQVAILRSRFAARVPPALAPCDAQLKYAHHPYIDVIPFREFRERTMAALACDPPLFSEDAMCEDLDAEGLVCWGGGTADGEGKRRRGMELEVPWDPQSWEPKEWFLQKYWFLVGGENGEMHTSARLWAQRRVDNENLGLS